MKFHNAFEGPIAGRAVLLTILVYVTIGAAQAVPSYTILDLGTLGGNNSRGVAINDAGQVTGTSRAAGSFIDRGFIHDGTSMKDIGSLTPAGTTHGTAINDAGWITGLSASPLYRAIVYDGSSMAQLGTFGGTQSYGYGINNLGHVTGAASPPSGPAHAFFYNGSSMVDLGTLGGTYSYGYGINNLDQITGYAALTGNTGAHAFLYTDGIMTDLGTLGGKHSTGRAVNDQGHVVGESTISGDSENHAFLYDGTSMKDLGHLGGDYSAAYALNESGHVVGKSTTSGLSYHAFIYHSSFGMLDLNALLQNGAGWTLNEALGINESGQITGTGTIDGYTRAFLLTPTTPKAVPESGGLVLFAALSFIAALSRSSKCGILGAKQG